VRGAAGQAGLGQQSFSELDKQVFLGCAAKKGARGSNRATWRCLAPFFCLFLTLRCATPRIGLLMSYHRQSSFFNN
jgi:hypothetical protein